MSTILSPEIFRVVLLAGIVNIHVYWTRLISNIVPNPYLDEVFHIPQAQAYWAGNWTQWDPKITTPPGLYLFSSLVDGIRKPITQSIEQTTTDLRSVNFWLLYLLLIGLYVLSALTKRDRGGDEAVLQKEFNIILFPLFFFFSGLYYTDLLSAFAVVVAYICWAAGTKTSGGRWKWQLGHLVAGLVAVATRQTNIFWVAGFLAGLQVIATANKVRGRYQIFDPAILGAHFEDFITTSISIGFTAISDLPTLLLDLWPQLSLLASFVAFVVWNKGVVLGDKSNHIASLHTPQMLYVWPFIVFFSWPLMIPHFFNARRLRDKFPRLSLAVIAVALMEIAVYFNTIVHPFTLADNRHYMFYVFRILMYHPAIKHLVVPVYFVCAWLVINALGGLGPVAELDTSPVREGAVRISFVWMWLVATTASLITAPLVEPRYFIIPWLMWRMHVPIETEEDTRMLRPKALQGKNEVVRPQHPFLLFVAGNILWLELAWFLLVNYLTCSLFLERGFEWTQEPGKVQRFMW